MKIALIIVIFACSLFCSPNVNLVSPYIINGFSNTYAMSFHPETFIGYYEIKVKTPERLEDGLDTSKSVLFMETEGFCSVGIKDRIEIGFFALLLPTELIFKRARFRFVFNLYDKGNDNLFGNIAISPFFGNSVNNVFYEITTDKNIAYFSNYCGISVGTRKLTQEKYSFELFASPEYLFTWYEFDRYFTYNTNGIAALLTQSIDVPIGFRYIFEKRTVKISIKSGIGRHFIANEKTIFEDDSSDGFCATISTSHSFKSSYFSAFAEMGIHFGREDIM